VLLRKRQSQDVFHHALQADFREPSQPSSELRIKEDLWVHTNIPQTGEVLVGRVNDPLLVGEAAGDLSEVPDRDGVNQVVGSSGAVHLDEIRAGGVTKPTGSFSVNSKGPFRLEEVIERTVKARFVLHQNDGCVECGGRERGLLLDVLAHEVARLGGSVATPSCVGGNPASMHTNSLHASK
jgi:hypothetical protein